jgi:hypothetical protein
MSERRDPNVIPEDVRDRLRSVAAAVGEEAIKDHAARIAAMWGELTKRGVPYEVAQNLVSEYQSEVLEHAFGKPNRLP